MQSGLNITPLSLDLAGVKHDAALATQRLWWKRAGELGPDDTAATVSTGHLSPDAAELGWSVWSGLLRVGLVDVSNPLA